MSEPSIILHAGAHKTGTTAIQAFATSHRKALAERGLYYPPLLQRNGRLRSESHNPLAHQFVRKANRQHLGPEWLHKHIALAGSGTLFLSGEAFWRRGKGDDSQTWLQQRQTYLQEIAAWLSPWPVEVVVVLRAQAAFAHSVYLEKIMKGSRRGRMDFPAFRAFLEQRHLRFYDNLRLLEDHLGPVRLLSYDELVQNNDLCHQFFAHLGCDTYVLAEPGRIRASLSHKQARIKRTLIPLMGSSRINTTTNQLLRNKVSGSSRSSYHLEFWSSTEEKQDWQARYHEENECIRKRYRPDLPKLFPKEF